MTASIPVPTDDVRPDQRSVLRGVTCAAWAGAAAAAFALSTVSLDGDGWVRPYVVFAVVVLVASLSTLWLAVVTTTPDRPTKAQQVGRAAAIGVGVLAIVATFVVPWAFALWGVIQAVTYLGLAATARPDARGVAWLGATLLTGVVLSVAGAAAEIGAPGSEGDYGQVQTWALTATAASMAVLVGSAPGWRSAGRRSAT